MHSLETIVAMNKGAKSELVEPKYDQIERIGKWVTYICVASASNSCREHRGYFEHDDLGEGGGLWFTDWELVDYDGVYELPEEVVKAIKILDFSLGEE